MSNEVDRGTSADEARVFPLPLSDFEYYMLVDDRPSHPMVFVMVIHLTGRLLRSEFQSSVDEAIDSHPLFDCVVQNLAAQGWCWTRAVQPARPIEWNWLELPGAEPSNSTGHFPPVVIRAIDLQRSRGLEIVVDETDTATRLTFYLHHACCDGIGGLQFVGEVLARYAQRVAKPGERLPEFQQTDVQALLARDCWDSFDEPGRPKRSLRRTLAKISRLVFRRPVPLPVPSVTGGSAMAPAAPPTETPRAIRTLALPQQISRQLQDLALEKKVSVNDLMLREMLLLIHDWHQGPAATAGDPWLRVGVPLSMRLPSHVQMPATNLVSYAFVTRRSSECRQPDQLLASIHRQTGDPLFHREGIVCLKFLHALRAIPGAMKGLLGFKSCFCTVVLANVGDIRRRFPGRFPLQDKKWRAGNVVVEQICGVAPVRPNTRAAITVGEYGGEMCLHLRTDATVMSDADSERFLREYSDRLIRLAESRRGA